MDKERINILIVEDEEAHSELITLSFESSSMPVSLVITRNLNEARVSIAKSVPDLVITDYVLPDGKGTELIPVNKEESPYPIAIMTSHGDEKVAVEAIKAGAFDYIVKSEAVLDDMPNICEKILLEWNYTIRHKIVEKELKESEARFHGILSSLYESAVVIYDRDGIMTALWGTPEMDKRYGLRAVDAIGRSIREIVPPEHAEQRVAEIRRVFDAGEKMLVEYMISVPGGNFWNETSLSPMRNANGNITAVVGFIRDVTDRKKAANRLNAQHFVTKVLAESVTIKEAFPKILKAVCTALEWDFGEIWILDQQENVLRNAEIWHMSSLKIPKFIAVTKQIAFSPQIGLPGRILASAKPLWVEDITLDTNFPRASVAAKEDLHGAFGFPIISGSEILGTVSFLSHEVREPDNDVLSMISAIGRQVGVFIKNKMVESDLCESEKRFRGIFEQAAVGIIHVDSNGQFLKANKRFCEITGYTDKEILGCTFWDITHPDDLNMQIQARNRVLDGETSSYGIEKRYIRKDDTVIWVNLSVALIRNSLDEPIYFVSVVEDITENKLIEERLRKLSHAVEQSSSTVVITDVEGNIEYVNPKFTQLTGYGIEEVIGKTPRILKFGKIPPEVYNELWDTIKSGNEWRGEFCNKKKTGVLYWESASISPVKDEKNVITNFIAVKDDITEKKQINEELKESEYRLKEAQHLAEIGSWEYNLETKQIKWSDEQYRIFGYQPKEIEPTFEKLIDAIHPDDRKAFIEKNHRCIDEDDKYDNEYRITRPDGTERIIHSQAKLKCDDSGNLTRMRGTVQDITGQKKMEETLLQSEKLKSLGEITAGVAHEFNNILAVVMGSAEVLEGGFKDDQELKRGLKAIIEAGEDGAGIVKRMLSFAKAELSESDYISIDIKYLVKQAMEFTMPRWKNMAQSEGIKYNINTVGITETPEVFCNPTELREVFVNLINNSLDAMPDGGVITMATRCVEHGGELKGDFIEITFSDTGKGMPEEVKGKIFDPFFTTRRPHGTGLGMSVTYGIMKRHGGTIEVESEVGKGATFTLHIPIRKEVVQRVVPSESVRKTETKKLRILVVDDEQEVCVILETFLTGKGHTVKVVNSGAEAIELSRREDFDIVLCDLAMPEVTGYDVIKAVNELDKIPKIGISTGWGDKLKLIDEEDLKVDFLIKKPFSLSELERKISDF
jgi:PAS domain S-box-containing protein